jgi:hypothetical protein
VREWLAAFHAGAAGGPPGERPLEGVAGPGDVVFVPRGWWHCVLNVEDSVAVTHNFCSEAGLPAVLRCLRDAPHTVQALPAATARFRLGSQGEGAGEMLLGRRGGV